MVLMSYVCVCAEAAASRRERKMVKKVPKGTSDYQAAWIVAEEEEEEEV